MSRARPRLGLLFALLLVCAAAPRADGACNETCRRDIARCMATQCAGVGRAACRRRCKPATIRTVAYVVSECREEGTGFVGRQELRIRRGDREPVTVAQFGPSEIIPGGFCRSPRGFGSRYGGFSVWGFPLQRLGVSPDGATVVFEVNDEFVKDYFPGAAPASYALSPEDRGLYVVGSNGRGRRRLGPASRDKSSRPYFTFSPPISFSPNGRRIAFTDLGPGPDDTDAEQIVVLDLATGERTPVTRLPKGTPPDLGAGNPEVFVTCCPKFIDNDTLVFQTFVDPDGSNPDHRLAAFRVQIDGSGLKALPAPVVLPGSHIVPTFAVAGPGKSLIREAIPGEPESPPTRPDTDFPIAEVFLWGGGGNQLQLTNFKRIDTVPGFLSTAPRRAFFLASADPLGTNRKGYCQLFSIGLRGSGLRQITHFEEPLPQVIPGCAQAGFTSVVNGTFVKFGCGIGYGYYRIVFQDPMTHAVVFDSTCDPVGANPLGGQIFAMRPNGSGLRQLTETSGLSLSADGKLTAELVGPFAYSAAPH